MFDVSLKHGPRYAPFQHQAGTHAAGRQRTDSGGIRWRVPWDGSDGPFALWGPGIAGGHVQGTADLVNHDELGSIDLLLGHGKAHALPGVAFPGNQRLFFVSAQGAGWRGRSSTG